jgi:peptidoglycan/xylan/chitin deacetylase (PgdA/CDA1 family)
VSIKTRSSGLSLRPGQIVRGVMSIALPRRMFVVRGPIRSGAVCLTFDDGPHPVYTPAVLDTLREQGALATFFLIGQQVEKHPDLVRRIVAEGHAIGHHTFSHSKPSDTSAGQLMKEIERTDELMREIAAKPSMIFRPPYGKVSAAKLRALWRRGMSVVLWNMDPKDYATPSEAELRTRLESETFRGGDVILLHDVIPVTVSVLSDLIRKIRAAGLGFATMDQWIARPDAIAGEPVAIQGKYGSAEHQS